MRVIVIGGTGHIGTYLVPRLVAAGYEVIVISRQQRAPYQLHGAWKSVQQITVDRAAADQAGSFGQQVRALAPDVVIDLICYTLDSARQLAVALQGQVRHLLHCGTIWVHGHSVQVPTIEDQARRPFGDYGVNKLAIETFLLGEAQRTGFPATVLHPGHIVGPGWMPVNPAANRNRQVWARLARGEEVVLPHLGLETLHHVHADDVAQAFMQALAHWSSAVGESFHVVSPAALTLCGYAEEMAAWFGQPAQLRFAPWEEWQQTATEDERRSTWDHIAHSPNCSIAKAQRLLHYQPRYSSLQAVQEAVAWLIDHDGLLEA
ncbi:MAG: NAD-dependent epimerase/dehydratase family protein [Chloroflexi bacterium]|nr:NAD-dependent epimerase/dehydratase family protein [Chloroflexota bacterium]